MSEPPQDPPTQALTEVDFRALLAELTERAGGEVDPQLSLRTEPPSAVSSVEALAALAAGASADGWRLSRVQLAGPEADFVPGETLGRGGMGEVSVARDAALLRDVAIKRLYADADEAAEQALLREALLTGALEHPNLVPVHGLGRDEAGQPVLIMKRVAGTSWRELLSDPEHETWASLPDDRLAANLEVLRQVCLAAHFAHSRGVLHRDIKPTNVMVGAFGEVYLVDWGLGLRLSERALAPAGVVGTLAYMAPEMLGRPEELTPLTDVYLLGATLHEVLTGAQRHLGDSPYNVLLNAHRSAPYDYPPQVPRELADLCNRATHRDPDQRPASALEFARALERFVTHRGSSEVCDGALEQLAALERVWQSELPGAEPEQRAEAELRAASLLATCRFGFAQALEAWPENHRARQGLQRCLEQALTRALARSRVGLARSLLAELPEARPQLEASVAEAEAAAARASERLGDLEREHDLATGGRERAWLTGALALAIYGVVFGLAALVLTDRLPFNHTTSAGFGLLIGLLLLTHLYLGKGFLLATRPNRTLVGLVAACWLTCMLNVAVCWAYDLPAWTLILYTGVLLTALAVHAAILVDARLWVTAAIGAAATLVGLVSRTIDPLLVHIVAGLLAGAYLAGIWSRDARSGASSQNKS